MGAGHSIAARNVLRGHHAQSPTCYSQARRTVNSGQERKSSPRRPSQQPETCLNSGHPALDNSPASIRHVLIDDCFLGSLSRHTRLKITSASLSEEDQHKRLIVRKPATPVVSIGRLPSHTITCPVLASSCHHFAGAGWQMNGSQTVHMSFRDPKGSNFDVYMLRGSYLACLHRHLSGRPLNSRENQST